MDDRISVIQTDLDVQQVKANLEYTHPELAGEFLKNLIPFFEVFQGNKIFVTTGGNPVLDDDGNLQFLTTTVTPGSNNDEMQTALQNLLIIARDGLTLPAFGDNSANPRMVQEYLTVEMVRDLGLLMESLKSAGVTIPTIPATGTPTVSISDAQAAEWLAIAAQTSVNQVLFRGKDVSLEGNRTLQAFIELEYIKTGSEVLGSSLASLEEALGATKDSLDILQELQSLHNRLTAEKRAAVSGDFITVLDAALTADGLSRNSEEDDDIDNFVTVLRREAEEYFGEPLIPEANLADTLSRIQGVRTRLDNVIAILDARTDDTGENTLVARLKKVRDDISGINNNSDVTVWLLDNFTNPEETIAGEIQDRITTAITAGESLNDSQKEEVRRVLFLFEEYYKSAAAILIKITQLIEKIAQGIAR